MTNGAGGGEEQRKGNICVSNGIKNVWEMKEFAHFGQIPWINIHVDAHRRIDLQIKLTSVILF